MATSFELFTADVLQLSGEYHKPASETKGVVIIIHGMGEHFGRYKQVAAFFAGIGYSTVGMDLRGHGRSQGKRGHTPSFNHLMSDIDLLVEKTATLFGGQPVFLYGHSMGGNLAANYVLRRKPTVQGLILTGPYFRLAFEPPRWKFVLAKALAGILPAFTTPTGLDLTALSWDAAVVAAYRSDPLTHDKISALFFTAVHGAGLYPIEHAKELDVKTLVMHGTADRLTAAEGTIEFASKNQEMIELKLWEGCFHEIHNEHERQEVFSYIAEWMARQDATMLQSTTA